jgi:hypothetical protein
MAYVYRHIRLDKNEPFYIGIGSDDIYKRAYSSKNRNKHWKHVVTKTEYAVEIMIPDLTWAEACQKEREFIKFYGRKDLKKGTLCNYTDGGEGVLGLVVTIESRDKMRKAQLGKIQSSEQIAKRVAKLSGTGNPWYGKQFSLEYKEKLSKAKLGKKRNPEVMKKLHDDTKKRVLDLKTNITYRSIGDLANEYKVHGSTAGRWLISKSSQFKLIV